MCIFGSRTFVPVSWMCKERTSVSHSSTESEIISLDAGLRLDGLPGLELWDRIFSSESAGECSTSIQETGAGGSTPNSQR